MAVKILMYRNYISIQPTEIFWGTESESKVKNEKLQYGGSNLVAKILIFCKKNNILPIGVFVALSPNPR